MAAVGAEDGHFGDQARPYGNYYQELVIGDCLFCVLNGFIIL